MTDTCWVLNGTHDGKRYRFRLMEGGNTVGSRQQNQICLETSGISKHHAVLRLTDGRVTVEDLASKNGTFVNGRRVQQSPLEVGDEITFASLRLALQQTAPEDGELAISFASPLPSGGESGLQETPQVDRRSAAGERPGVVEDLVYPAGWLPGRSAVMVELFDQMRSLVGSHLPVLILGETGVGKEGLARTLHLSSPRSAGPFVAINCAAIPQELLESELFGIAAGVATGVGERQGRFLEAHGGSLFLDEIGDLPLALQAKLLRVLQEGEIQPLGMRPKPLDVRVIAATHADLTVAMASGRFRRDLFYRLAGVALHLPPLRQRRQDIPELVAHFLTASARQSGKDIRGLTVDALRLAVEQPWPGNVRQLQHAVERWVHRCPKHQVVDADLVVADLAAAIGTAPVDTETAASRPEAGEGDLSTSVDSESNIEHTPGELDPRSLASLDLATVEAQLIREALRRTQGHLTQAAQALGLSRQALRRRLDRYGIRAT